MVPKLTQRLIDQGVMRQDMGVIVRTALTMLGLDLLSACLAVANTILAVSVSQSVAADIRGAVVRQVQHFSFGNLDRLQTGQLLVRTTSDISHVQQFVLMTMRMLIRAPLMLAGSVALLIVSSRTLALLMAALFPVIALILWVFLIKGKPLFGRVQKRLDRLNTVLQENLSGVRVVKAFVRSAREAARFGTANQELAAQSTQVLKVMAYLNPAMSFALNLALVGVVWLGGYQVTVAGMSAGQLVAATNYLLSAMFPILLLTGIMGPLASAEASGSRILEVLDNQPEVQSRPGAVAPQTIRGRVAFEDVSFAYTGTTNEPVLRCVNLVAEPGERVAVLGATGSGKSTLVHLIPRFYDVTGGRVTLDGVDVRDWPLEVLRAQVGVALQEAVLFSGSVRDNIRYGRPDASEEEVVAAAQAAQIHDFVASLPNGYDTLVGQRGVNFSGGQKQRLSIARALLVRPRILILDDSTSAVDVETEGRIEEALETLIGDSTSFVVAQRISTVLMADRIVVLERGQVAASGTHQELMATSPIYREIYASQLGDGGAQHA
jgi:ATP-binding cassette subfamily B protein